MILLGKADAVRASLDELDAFQDWQQVNGAKFFRDVAVMTEGCILLPCGESICSECPERGASVGCSERAVIKATTPPPPLGHRWRGVVQRTCEEVDE